MGIGVEGKDDWHVPYLMSSSGDASMPASFSICIPSAKRNRGALPSGILKLPASGYSR